MQNSITTMFHYCVHVEMRVKILFSGGGVYVENWNI
jgi:hypothetical protein